MLGVPGVFSNVDSLVNSTSASAVVHGPGTIRLDFGQELVRQQIHSDETEEKKSEEEEEEEEE